MSVSWFSNFPHCFRFFNTLLCDSLTFSSTQSWNRAQLSILRVLNPEIKLTERKGWCLHICENKITDLSTSDCVNFIYVCMFICSCVYICVCIHVAVRGRHQVSLIALQAHFLSQGLSLTLTLSSSASLAGQGAPAFYLCLPRDYECIQPHPVFHMGSGESKSCSCVSIKGFIDQAILESPARVFKGTNLSRLLQTGGCRLTQNARSTESKWVWRTNEFYYVVIVWGVIRSKWDSVYGNLSSSWR